MTKTQEPDTIKLIRNQPLHPIELVHLSNFYHFILNHNLIVQIIIINNIVTTLFIKVTVTDSLITPIITSSLLFITIVKTLFNPIFLIITTMTMRMRETKVIILTHPSPITLYPMTQTTNNSLPRSLLARLTLKMVCFGSESMNLVNNTSSDTASMRFTTPNPT